MIRRPLPGPGANLPDDQPKPIHPSAPRWIPLINFTGDQGIFGRVQPGDTVDVLASFARDQGDAEVGDMSYRRADIPYNVSGILVQNAEVVSVGQAMDAGAGTGEAAEGASDPDVVVPVTFAVTVGEATQLAYGESFAISMRIIRSGNNETGSAFEEDDQSFQDIDLGPNFQEAPEEERDEDGESEADEDDGEATEGEEG